MKKLLSILFLLIVVNLIAQVNIEVTPHNVTYNLFYPAYFDPDHPELQPHLFRMTLTTEVGGDFIIICVMEYQNYNPAEATLTPIIENFEGIYFTNSDIITSIDGPYFTVVNNFDDFLEDIGEAIEETGRLPDGTYVFTISAYAEGSSEPCDQEVVTVNIISPISISLITPGNPIGLGPAPISDNYPNFIWFSNLFEYTIKVFEIDGEYTTPEEIELLDPYFEDLCTITSYLYPTDAPDLMIGRTYAWQVSADVLTPVGEEGSYKSIIYSFLISTDQEEDMNNQILINFLEQLSIEGLEELIALINSGYDVKNIFWQGSTISMDELNDILEQIANGDLIIENISVE
ncbi:MAG: hypothetical protein ISS80_00330 [Candidatus Cloacimonetes bacterium]|nr:hypothetical protein [Candidatus Cloacimonadota bacterium]